MVFPAPGAVPVSVLLPIPSVSDPFSLIDFLPFLAVTARLSVNQTLSTKIRIATSMGFLSASSMLREEN